MKKILLSFLFIIFFLQYSFLPVFYDVSIAGPELIVAFVMVLYLKKGLDLSFVWAFLIGLLVDYFSTAPLGTFCFIFVVLSGMIEVYKSKFEQSKNKALMIFVTIFSGLVAADMIFWFLTGVTSFFGLSSNVLFFSEIDLVAYFVVKLVFSFFGCLVYFLLGKTLNFFGMYSNELKLGNI